MNYYNFEIKLNDQIHQNIFTKILTFLKTNYSVLFEDKFSVIKVVKNCYIKQRKIDKNKYFLFIVFEIYDYISQPNL